MSNYTVLEAGEGKHVKAWMDGVDFGSNTIEQLKKAARLSCVHPYVAAMPGVVNHAFANDRPLPTPLGSRYDMAPSTLDHRFVGGNLSDARSRSSR